MVLQHSSAADNVLEHEPHAGLCTTGFVPSGKPPEAVPRPGVVGAHVVAVAEVQGATTKFGAVAVPLFAAVKPCDETPVLLTVFVRLNT